MRRRQFTLIMASALCLPASGADKQQRRIGLMLNVPLASASATRIRQTLAKSMRDLGWIDGKDYIVDWRSSEGRYERIPGLVADLVSSNVDVIITLNTLSTIEAKRLTHSIPIVFGAVNDPVGNAIVKDLAHPEANVTGFTASTDSVLSKHLDILLAANPRIARIGLLRNPDNVKISAIEQELQVLLRVRGLPPITMLEAKNVEQLTAAFASARRMHLQAIIIYADGFFLGQSETIGALAVRARMPAIATSSDYARGGVLFSYGENVYESVGGIAGYVVKLLNGASPSTLPVQRPRNFPLIINRKTAKAIGFELNNEILLRADEVIE